MAPGRRCRRARRRSRHDRDRGAHLARADPLQQSVRRARQPLPAPGRSARRRLDRKGLAALPVARLRLRPAHRHSPAGFPRRAGESSGRSARRRRVRGVAARAPARPHRLRPHGRNDERVGRHARVRHGRSLEPRLRRRDARGRDRAATSRSSASATKARPRSRPARTASSPDSSRRASRSRVPAPRTCSPACTTPRSIARRCSRYRARCRRRSAGRGAFQDLDLAAAFADVAVSTQTVQRDSDHVELMNLACKHALIQRGVAHLVLPDEVQALPAGGRRARGRTERPAGRPRGRAARKRRSVRRPRSSPRAQRPVVDRRPRRAARHRRRRAARRTS